jgi:hypothetical protein
LYYQKAGKQNKNDNNTNAISLSAAIKQSSAEIAQKLPKGKRRVSFPSQAGRKILFCLNV